MKQSIQLMIAGSGNRQRRLEDPVERSRRQQKNARSDGLEAGGASVRPEMRSEIASSLRSSQ
jgi:hypothetical protein